VHPGDLAGGFSDLEMTWLVYCTGAATGDHCVTCSFTTSYKCSHVMVTACCCWCINTTLQTLVNTRQRQLGDLQCKTDLCKYCSARRNVRETDDYFSSGA